MNPSQAEGSLQRDGRKVLLPKEHGPTAQLLLPLAAALLAGNGSLRGFAWAAGAVLLYLALEPLRVLLGQRGERLKVRSGAFVWGQLAAWGALGLVALMFAFLSGPTALVGLPLGLALPALALLFRRQERSTAAQTLVASALCAWSAPTAEAAGVGPWCGLGLWAVFSVGFFAATFGVRRVIASHRPGGGPIAWSQRWPLVGAALFSPPLGLTALALTLSPPHPRDLRRVGWKLVAASVGTAAMLVALVRAICPGA